MATAKTKEIGTAIVVGLYTGVSLGNFGDIHEAAEWIAGHPIWTHEFAEKRIWDKLRNLIAAQHPEIRAIKLDAMSAPEAEKKAADLCETFGDTLSMTEGTGERTESPLASFERIAPGKPVLVVVVPK